MYSSPGSLPEPTAWVQSSEIADWDISGTKTQNKEDSKNHDETYCKLQDITS